MHPSIDQIATWYQLEAEGHFPGRVIQKGFLLIEALVGLPSHDLTPVKEFRIPNRSPDLREGEFVSFSCEIPIRPGGQGPYAKNIERIKESTAKKLAEGLRDRLAVGIKHELTHKLTLQLEDLESQRAKREQEIILREQKLDKEVERVQALDQDLKQRALALELREAAVKEVEIRVGPFLPADSLSQSMDIYASSDFKDLYNQWPFLLGSMGHIATNDRASEHGFLLSLLCALLTGELLLLDGPVGVGKTSIVERAAKVLTGLDDASGIIPVRPGWIDSTDLVGFYDPMHQEFQPTSFLTALNQARSRRGRLHLICLDELNLARIENYGADLLSCMEYRDKRGLPLYSPDIERAFRARMQSLTSTQNGDLRPKQLQRGQKIAQMLKSFPAEYLVPDNAVILGTLNSDETTYDISPKVIDRSFVVRLPVANLDVPLPVEDGNGPQNSVIDLDDFRDAVRANIEAGASFEGLWEQVLKLQPSLKVLGIPLGYRIKRDLLKFAATSLAIGLTDPQTILKHFVLAKVLPRIRCQRDKDTDAQWQEFLKLLDPFLKTDSTGVIENLKRQWDDPACYTVRYFDVVK